jgi:beta-fructofuranosidase
VYKPLGFYDELGDVEVIEANGRIHLFHLCLNNRDQVGHIVSDDGLSWQVLPPAIRTGRPGSCDDDCIRTVSVTAHQGRYYMVYTAISTLEGGLTERNALAVSDDLLDWRKHDKNPIIESDRRWYEADGDRISWRDPKPFFENGTFYATVCGRRKEGPILRRGAAALATSEDLVNWEVRPPVESPRWFYEIECPQIYKIGLSYYLIGSTHEEVGQRYWVSDSVEGPYRTIGGGLLRPPASHYAGRLARVANRDAFFCWNTHVADGSNPWGRRSVRGVHVRYIPAPLEAVQESDGSLSFRSWHAWDHYRAARDKSVDVALEALLQAPQTSVGPGWRIDAPHAAELAVGGQELTDFVLEARLSLDGSHGGLVFHGEQDATGYFLELCPARSTVRLIRHLHGMRPETGSWFDHKVLQEQICDLSNARSGLDVRLIVATGEIELSIADRVVISTVSTARLAGRLGLYVDSGTIALSEPALSRLRSPGVRIGDHEVGVVR